MLLAIAAAALLVRLFFIRVHPVNYDGYWHVFIARNLSRELGALAHPPLYPLLLRRADAVAHTRLSYLSISLVSGVAAVVLVASVLAGIAARREMPLVGALALALSPNAIALSGIAESYMLCTAFVLAATRAYLDLIVPAPPEKRGRSAAAFSVWASLALLTHYAAGLFLLATAAAPFVLAALEPGYRRRWTGSSATRVAAAFLPPLFVAAALFHFLARAWVHRLSHVAEFYFAVGRETIPAYLARALAGTFVLFSPVAVGSPPAAAAALLAFLAAVVAIAVRADRRRGDSGAPAATPAVLLVLLVGIEAAAGIAGRYPFGGGMRHQFLLLLFALLAGAAAFDRVLAGQPRGTRSALVALAVAAVAANSWAHRDPRWRPRPEPFAAERERFDRDFPDATEVHVDQFNLVAFFAQHHDWDWRFLGTVGGHPSVERYRVSTSGRTIDLVAHRDFWNFDPASPATSAALAGTSAAGASRDATLFAVRQSIPGEPAPDPDAIRRRIPALAAGAGLETGKVDVFPGGVFADFRRAAPTPPAP